MKNIKLLIIMILMFSLAACGDREECDMSKVPSYTFTVGEKAIFKKTGEIVRVNSEWKLLFVRECEKLHYAKYSVIFMEDGAEISVSWDHLEKINY